MPTIADVVDPGMYSLEEAVELAQQLMKSGQRVPERMAAALQAERLPDIGRAERMLELLPRIAPPERLLPLLGSLLPSPDTRIRSKARKLYAAASADLGWAMQQLDDDDPRVAANVVEALWKAEPGEQLAHIFERAAAHSNNRIAGNGLVGLLRMKHPAGAETAGRMARHEEPSFRATAAWAIGQAGWRDGMAILRELQGDETGKVKLAAERSLAHLNRTAAPVS